MKTKNLVLGIFAFTTAIGGAFASTMITNPDVFVIDGSCRDITDVCDGSSTGVTCRVSVENVQYDAYLAGCQTKAKHSNSNILTAHFED